MQCKCNSVYSLYLYSLLLVVHTAQCTNETDSTEYSMFCEDDLIASFVKVYIHKPSQPATHATTTWQRRRIIDKGTRPKKMQKVPL